MDSVILPELPTYLFAPNLAGVLSLALTVILPLLAALFMRARWSATTKGLVLLAVAAVKAFLEAWAASVADSVAFDFAGVGYAIVINWGLAVVFYFGLLQRSAVQQAALHGGVVRDKTIDGQVGR
jgi:hypothetical protein